MHIQENHTGLPRYGFSLLQKACTHVSTRYLNLYLIYTSIFT